MRFCIINTNAGVVQNVTEGAPPELPANYIAVANEGAQIGWQWDGSAFHDPNPPVPAPAPGRYLPAATLLARLSVAEYTGIQQAAAAALAQGNGQLSLWLEMARVAPNGIDLGSPVTAQAKVALVAAGLLTQARAEVVFAAP